MSVLIRSFILALIFNVAPPIQIFGQFGYVGADVGFQRMGLDGERGKGGINRGNVSLSAVYRPFRNLGFGASISIPFTERVNYDMKGTGVWSYNSGRSALYKPYISNIVDLKEELSVFLRLFPSPNIPLFFDLRLRSYLMEQSFSMLRFASPAEYYEFSGDLKYPAIPAYSNGFSASARSIAPGLSIGTLSHVGEQGYFFTSFDLDFVEFNIPSFTLTIEADHDYSSGGHEYTTVRNTISTPTITYAFRMGGGIRF